MEKGGIMINMSTDGISEQLKIPRQLLELNIMTGQPLVTDLWSSPLARCIEHWAAVFKLCNALTLLNAHLSNIYFQAHS